MAKTEKHKKISIKYYLNKDLKSQKKMTVNGEVDTHPVYVRIIYDKTVNRFRFPDEKVGFLSDEDFEIFENSQVAHNLSQLIEKCLKYEINSLVHVSLHNFGDRLSAYQLDFNEFLKITLMKCTKDSFLKKVVSYSDYKSKVEPLQYSFEALIEMARTVHVPPHQADLHAYFKNVSKFIWMMMPSIVEDYRGITAIEAFENETLHNQMESVIKKIGIPFESEADKKFFMDFLWGQKQLTLF